MNNLDYLRAHQYLYYCLGFTVVSDSDYDEFGAWSKEDYKGGSDLESSYSNEQKKLAFDMKNGLMPFFPQEYNEK